MRRPRAAACGWRAYSTSVAMPSRSTGSRWLRPRWLRARISSASMRCSCCSPAASTSWHADWNVPTVAAGSLRAASISARARVSGVRSSWEALATKDRWASKAPSSRGEQAVDGVAEFPQLARVRARRAAGAGCRLRCAGWWRSWPAAGAAPGRHEPAQPDGGNRPIARRTAGGREERLRRRQPGRGTRDVSLTRRRQRLWRRGAVATGPACR